MHSRPPSPASSGQRALERCCTKTGQRRRRGAGDALARRIVAHVFSREPENGHRNSISVFFEIYVFEFLQLVSVRRKKLTRTCRKGISGEVHGNLEADLAVLTPACGSCSFYGRALPFWHEIHFCLFIWSTLSTSRTKDKLF